MIILDSSLFIGKGAHRSCYIHPTNKNLCVKLNMPHQEKEIKRERKYYRHLEKRKISWDMIPRYYGEIETNLGRGSLFDLIVDTDGHVSQSLHRYLLSPEKTERFFDGLCKSLRAFKEYLYKNRIITMDLDPTNILCQKNDMTIVKFFIVDNVYNTEFIPMSNYSKNFARRKITRKWQRFENKLLETYSHNRFILPMIAKSKE
ncbi:MAG TPA: YrbL family protein [Smithella sp.]|nr:YrbL family protein [Smithella sp.]